MTTKYVNHVSHVINEGVTDSDEKPTSIEVCASVGEFDGVLMEVWGLTYENVELNPDATRALIAALTSALNVLEGNQETCDSTNAQAPEFEGDSVGVLPKGHAGLHDDGIY